MSEPLSWCCIELLALAARLPQSAHLPPPAELRQSLMTALDTMVGRGRAAGFPDTDLAEARYALVAFIDEQILKSNWPGRNEWMGRPLQLDLYGEYTAGENFFNRMRALLQQGNSSPALEVYYLCLVLGFRGAYGATGDHRTLTTFYDSARQRVTQAWPATAKLAPHAEPPDRLPARRSSHSAMVAVIVASLLAAIVAIVGLERLLNGHVEASLDLMRSRDVPALQAPH